MTPMRSVTLVMTGSKLTNLSNYLSVSTKGQLISKCPYEKSVWTKYQRKYSALEVYYFEVNTKRESMFCLQEDRLCFVVTLK